ncbi:MAG: PEP-CTERM sorting domain-containing protein [Sandarakinorhabdus sp.]|nr:PEP-CTERM sorting domain-containing protein [Sandarakinorhabdus sp.]
MFAAGLALTGLVAAPAAATSAVDVVATNCISVTNSAGCLFTGNIAPSTVTDTQTAYNLFNDTHPSANPDITLTYLFKSDDVGFPGSLTGGLGTSGTWSTPGYLVDFLAVKAANNFVLYQLATPASSGSWNTFNIPYLNKKGEGNPHDLSHLAFFGKADDGGGDGTGNTVPEPASWAMLITGFSLVGFAARRRQRLESVTS